MPWAGRGGGVLSTCRCAARARARVRWRSARNPPYARTVVVVVVVVAAAEHRGPLRQPAR